MGLEWVHLTLCWVRRGYQLVRWWG